MVMKRFLLWLNPFEFRDDAFHDLSVLVIEEVMED